MIQIVKIHLNEQILRLMKSVSYRKCKKKNLGRKRNVSQNS